MSYQHTNAPARRRRAARRPATPSRAGLGFVPAVVVAAVPSVKTIVAGVTKTLVSSLRGLVDPGVKRDREREARAQMYLTLATQGSLTAARRLLSGATSMNMAAKEIAMYAARWATFKSANAALAEAALAAGPLPIPDPQRPELSSSDEEQIQAEIAAAHGPAAARAVAGGALAPAAVAGVSSSSSTTLLVAASVLGALLMGRKGGRR